MNVPKHIKQAVLQGKKVYRFTPEESVCFSNMNGQIVTTAVPVPGVEYSTPTHFECTNLTFTRSRV